MAALNILPVAELRHPVSLSTSVHFWGPQSIKEIISTVYHLVHDRHRLLHHHHAAPLADNVNHLTFLLDHDHDYPILENQLRDLELSFGGAISLFSTLTDNTKVDIMVTDGTLYMRELYLTLCNAIGSFIKQVNAVAEVTAKQVGPIEKWQGYLSSKDNKDPLYDYIVGFGTDKAKYPAIIFKMGVEGDGQKANSKMGHLMAKVPVRLVVRIRLALLPKGWKQGESTDVIDSSTVSVWQYDAVARQAKCVQGPQPLSTKGGHVALWVSDFLSEEDDAIPEHLKRPCPKQDAYKTPNLKVDYATIAAVIKDLAVALDRTKTPIVKTPAIDGTKIKTRGFTTLAGPAITNGQVCGMSTRNVSTMAPRGPAVAFRPIGGAIPSVPAGAAVVARKVGVLCRRFRT